MCVIFCSALAASVAVLPAFGRVGAAKAADEGQGVASSRMSYSRFLEYLDMGRVKKVQTCCCICCHLYCAAQLACPPINAPHLTVSAAIS